MKNIICAFVLLVLMFQSCSHQIVYSEYLYQPSDSPYPVSSRSFAYKANNASLPASLQKLTDKLVKMAWSDSQYNTPLPSADEYLSRITNEVSRYNDYKAALDNLQKQLTPQQASGNHEEAINNLNKLNNALSDYRNINFSEYWRRVFQLSHRGILQHYIDMDSDYKNLSSRNKALVYGAILKADFQKCDELVAEMVSRDQKAVSDLSNGITRAINQHKSAIEAIERQKRAEAEKLRKQREAEERAKQERIQREKAEKRWASDSWLNGKWGFKGPFGVTTIYIDTAKQTVKQYTKLNSSNPFSPAALDYSGPYRIYTEDALRVITFGATMIYADPDNGKLFDLDGGYFTR